MLYSNPIPYVVNAGAYYAAIADLPWAIWLDSGGRGRYDILVAQPIATLVTQGDSTEICDSKGRRRSTDDPLDLLREQIGTPISSMPDIPFCGGAMGYWGYDLARRWVALSGHINGTEKLPDMAMGIYDWAVLIDHQEQEARLVSRLRAPETAGLLPDILEHLRNNKAEKKTGFQVCGSIRANLSRGEYDAAFDKISGYLMAGDCYQVNLAQRFTADASGDALEAYLSLREISPAPYSAFLNLPQAQILSVSPERFLSVQNGNVETKPIKGTRQRGIDAQSEARLIEDLRTNEKDRAENLMIVDLLRNDLSKSCVAGSVEVQKLFEVESFANVHHLVSTITGKLASGNDALSLLRNCFPGGSITGAPKKRAMEIIEQLEPQRRGVYCGAIGYVGWDGNMDTNIAIRTLIYANGKLHCSVGGGIVADSNVAAEYQETLDKAAGMLKLFGLYGGT
ncbi:MAG: para-aminobenzoate synthetase component [Gallionellaceae bacterium]|nr:MAG: para-aminobenzoate synthetase component [Gallionellaceae bacterium]